MARIAVLIDAENIAVQHAAAIAARVAALGDPHIVRLFGDFTEQRLAGWLDVARANGYQPVLQLSGGKARNSTDIALVIDAMDILHSTVTDAFCLVSDDRDFLPLATRLRAAGKRVHVICKSSDARLGSVCSSVHELAPRLPEPPIVAAFRKIAAGRAEMGLSEAGKLLREHLPGVIPTSGKSPLRKSLEATGRFAFDGTGSAIRVRLKP